MQIPPTRSPKSYISSWQMVKNIEHTRPVISIKQWPLPAVFISTVGRENTSAKIYSRFSFPERVGKVQLWLTGRNAKKSADGGEENKNRTKQNLVGGFNPSEKYQSNWIISPRIGVKIKSIWNHHLEIRWIFISVYENSPQPLVLGMTVAHCENPHF